MENILIKNKQGNTQTGKEMYTVLNGIQNILGTFAGGSSPSSPTKNMELDDSRYEQLKAMLCSDDYYMAVEIIRTYDYDNPINKMYINMLAAMYIPGIYENPKARRH